MIKYEKTCDICGAPEESLSFMKAWLTLEGVATSLNKYQYDICRECYPNRDKLFKRLFAVFFRRSAQK